MKKLEEVGNFNN